MTTINGAARYARGSDLSQHVQAQCKAQFVHRFTGDHRPAWADRSWRDGRAYPLQFANDVDWLNHTWFAVTLAGTLDRNHRSCHSKPTWPENPELRAPMVGLSALRLTTSEARTVAA